MLIYDVDPELVCLLYKLLAMEIKLLVHFYVFVQLRVSTSVAILSKSAALGYLEWRGRIKETPCEDAMRQIFI